MKFKESACFFKKKNKFEKLTTYSYWGRFTHVLGGKWSFTGTECDLSLDSLQEVNYPLKGAGSSHFIGRSHAF